MKISMFLLCFLPAAVIGFLCGAERRKRPQTGPAEGLQAQEGEEQWHNVRREVTERNEGDGTAV